jgi:Fe-S-cluster-containing hydrogenase component 2
MLRSLPLFDGLPNHELEQALAAGELGVRKLWRDEIVADDTTVAEGPSVFLVHTGQIAVAIFARGILETERREFGPLSLDEKQKKVRVQGPLIRLAEKNLATFGEGELFNAEALLAVEDPAEGGDRGGASSRCAFYCVSPAELLVFARDRLAHLTATYPFFAQRLRRAVEVARDRLAGVTGIKQEILDFYVRHGLSVAETLRVRQIDRCIECKECEKACEERYGHKRLAIHGPRLGMLDFVYACRTCSDQRCINPCNYDSIRFDHAKGEVLINEATCTGCAACAEACPYGSIEMVELERAEEKLFKIRLDKAGFLKNGEGTGRKVAAAKIASKCDHCSAYGEQACITHCPTGALIEIKPADLFQDRGEVSRSAARSGFDQTVMLDSTTMLPSAPFQRGGLGITDGASAKVKQRLLPPWLIWALGLGAFFLAIAEVMLRLFKPTWSLQYANLRLGGDLPAMARLKVHFRPGDELAIWAGYVGTSLMIIALLYPLWKRVRLMQKIGSSAAWFDFHLMGGTVGPLFIALHSALRLDKSLITLVPFWSMIIVALSGVVGRYLYAQMPDLLHGRELDELAAERALARQRSAHGGAIAALEREVAAHRKLAAQVAARAGLLAALTWTIADDLKRPLRKWRRRHVLKKNKVPASTCKELLGHVSNLMTMERRRVLVPQAHGALAQWKKVHVAFTFVLAAMAAIHIYDSW